MHGPRSLSAALTRKLIRVSVPVYPRLVNGFGIATPLPAQPRKELTPMSPLSERRETPPAHEDDSDEEGSRGVRSRKRTARELPNGGDSDRDGSDEERSRGGPSRKRTTCEVPGGDDSDEQRRDIRNAKSHKKLHKRPQPAQQCPQKTRSQRRRV